MDSVATIIDTLGGVTKIAQHLGLPVSTVGSWKSRNKIPDAFRRPIVELATSLDLYGVTYESLTLMRSTRRPSPSQQAGCEG